MLFRDVVDLLNITIIKDADGFKTESETNRETVFANKKSVTNSEFYFASQQDIKLEVVFVIRLTDYSSQKYLLFDNKKYEIVRSYENGDFIELSCQAYKQDVT